MQRVRRRDGRVERQHAPGGALDKSSGNSGHIRVAADPRLDHHFAAAIFAGDIFERAVQGAMDGVADELNRRPDRLTIPIKGIQQILEQSQGA